MTTAPSPLSPEKASEESRFDPRRGNLSGDKVTLLVCRSVFQRGRAVALIEEDHGAKSEIAETARNRSRTTDHPTERIRHPDDTPA